MCAKHGRGAIEIRLGETTGRNDNFHCMLLVVLEKL